MSVLPRHLLPDTAVIDPSGSVSVGGCDMVQLAKEYGTPLFVYDEDHLRARCREAIDAFPDGVAYAAKAFLCGAMAQLAHDEGLYLDVATGGEIHVAITAGVPPERLIFHGNNKSSQEIRQALQLGIGRIVIDSDIEIDRIEAAVGDGLPAPEVSIRVNPGIEAHTHEYLQTGVADSKFGISLARGEALSAVERIDASSAMTLVGIHAHIGSQVFDVASFERAIGSLADFLGEVDVGELSVGGGLGVPYVEGETAPTIAEWGKTVRTAARMAGMTQRIVAEPGRAIVAAAALTLYTVGTIKNIPGIRTYVSVDGGMSDNPRPVLYGSGYEVFLPRATNADRVESIRVVGKHCESGDVLVWEGHVPAGMKEGDLLATPVTGAYGHTMGSNYNMILRPPVVFVGGGDARLVIRRETHDDLLIRDLAIG